MLKFGRRPSGRRRARSASRGSRCTIGWRFCQGPERPRAVFRWRQVEAAPLRAPGALHVDVVKKAEYKLRWPRFRVTDALTEDSFVRHVVMATPFMSI